MRKSSTKSERVPWTAADMPWLSDDRWAPAITRGLAMASVMLICKPACFQNLQDKVCILQSPNAVLALKAMKKGTLKIQWLMPPLISSTSVSV